MAHFAEINSDNIVLRVLVVPNDQESRGQQFLGDDLRLGGVWIQTSYNTWRGQHRLGGVPLRKNYAGIGDSYDFVRDAFIPAQPFNSWVLDEETCTWKSPVPIPTDGFYSWDEPTVSWVLVSKISIQPPANN